MIPSGSHYTVPCTQSGSHRVAMSWITRADRREPRESRSKKRIELRSCDVIFTRFGGVCVVAEKWSRQHRHSVAQIFFGGRCVPLAQSLRKLRSLGRGYPQPHRSAVPWHKILSDSHIHVCHIPSGSHSTPIQYPAHSLGAAEWRCRG